MRSNLTEVPSYELKISLYIIDLNTLRFPSVVILQSPILCFVFLFCSLYSCTAQWDQYFGKNNGNAPLTVINACVP